MKSDENYRMWCVCCVCVCVLSYGCPESAPCEVSEEACFLPIRTLSFATEEAGVVLRGLPGDLSRGQTASQLDPPHAHGGAAVQTVPIA